MKSNTLLVEKYRPDTLEGYIGNDLLKGNMAKWIATNDPPHLLFVGKAGVGKTTAAKILANTLSCDVLYVNASDKGNIDFIRTDIIPFASSVGFSDLKLVILDEADYISIQAQAALRNVMETSSATTRFILTCNYIDKILDPIQSRCEVYTITPPSPEAIYDRLSYILGMENIFYHEDDVKKIIQQTYPDVRKAIQLIGKFTDENGTLTIDDTQAVEFELCDKIRNILLSSLSPKARFTEIRKILVQMNDYNELYRYLYDNIDDFKSVASAILIIADAQYQDAFVVDHELNAAAMIVKLIQEQYDGQLKAATR